MFTVLLLMSLLSMTTLCCPILSAEGAAGVIATARHHFNPGFLVLLYGPGEQKQMLPMFKLISKGKFFTVALRFRSFRGFHGRLPLCVLSDDQQGTQTFLQQISERDELKGCRWLVFLGDRDPSTFLDQVHIPFDVDFMVARLSADCSTNQLSEVYRVAPGGPLQTVQLGNWRRKLRIAARDPRNDLQGVELLATAAHSPPITTVSAKDNVTLIGGYFGNVWAEMERIANFRTRWVSLNDLWGADLGNGTWDGMVGQLMDGKAMVAVNDFTMTYNRAMVIDFTSPLLFTRYSVFIRQPDGTGLVWSCFLKPFSARLWLSVLSALILITVTVYSLFHVGRGMIHCWPHVDPICGSLFNCLFYIHGVFCMQGSDMTPITTTCRIAYLTAHMTAVVLLAAYSAELVSSLTSQKLEFPFTTLAGLLQDGTYELGVLQDSAELLFFQNSTDAVMTELYYRNMAPNHDNLPATVEEGLERVCQTRFAFLTALDNALTFINDASCRIVLLPHVAIKVNLAMALAKNNPYRTLINNKLQRLRVGGVLKRLRQLSWPTPLDPVEQSWTSVDLWGVTPVLVYLSAGILVALILLLLESLLCKQWQHRLKRQQAKLLLLYKP